MSPFLGPHAGPLTNSAISTATREEDRGFIKEERHGAKEGTGGCAGEAPKPLLCPPPKCWGLWYLNEYGSTHSPPQHPMRPKQESLQWAYALHMGLAHTYVQQRGVHDAHLHAHTDHDCIHMCTHTAQHSPFPGGLDSFNHTKALTGPQPPRPHAPNSSPPPPAHPGAHPWVLPDVANKVLSGTPLQEQGAGWGA